MLNKIKMWVNFKSSSVQVRTMVCLSGVFDDEDSLSRMCVCWASIPVNKEMFIKVLECLLIERLVWYLGR